MERQEPVAGRLGLRLTLVLAPGPVARSLVVYASQEVKDPGRHLLSRDAEFLVQLALGGPAGAVDGSLQLDACLGGRVERMRAAGVGPHSCNKPRKSNKEIDVSNHQKCVVRWVYLEKSGNTGKGNLLVSALLQEQTLLGIEQKDGEGTVEKASINI